MIFGNSIAVRIRGLGMIAALSLGLLVVSGCETTDTVTNDPFEDINRAIFKFNNTLDNAVIEPVAETYVEHVPEALRKAILNSLRNLKTPVILANNILQGDFNGAGTTLSRFVTNTFVGFGGMADVASKSGAPFRDEDFGQTLAVWGIDEGPYLVLPILGPMNVRDGAGKLADSHINPLGEIDNTTFEWSHRGVDAVDTRAGLLGTLDDLERTSLDYYAAIRSLYRQKRLDDVMNGESDAPVPNISFDDEDENQNTPLGAQTSANRTK